jgi:hypothetical protein
LIDKCLRQGRYVASISLTCEQDESIGSLTLLKDWEEGEREREKEREEREKRKSVICMVGVVSNNYKNVD